MRLTMTLLLLAATLPSLLFAQEGKPEDQPDPAARAKALFEAQAKALAGARVSFEVSGTMKTEGEGGGPGNGQFSGSAHLTPTQLKAKMSMMDDNRQRGKTLIVDGDKAWESGRDAPKAANKGAVARFRGVLAMGGFFFAGRFGGPHEDKPLAELCRAENFAMGAAADAGEGKTLLVITYDFRVMRFKDNVAKVTLWIDRETKLPHKREVRVANRPGAPITVLTELYTKRVNDGKHAEGTFALPKAEGGGEAEQADPPAPPK